MAPNSSIRFSEPARYPAFDQSVPDDGYRWWYVDGISDDEQHAISLIAFVGSVFSPWYAWARTKGPTSAAAHCALNVALYSPGKDRWAMTERYANDVERTPDHFRIGPSSIRWDGRSLIFKIEERSAPFLRSLLGEVRVTPVNMFQREYSLAEGDRHWWQPVAPSARIEVAFDKPRVAWRGHAYMDSNRGSEPLERGFSDWYWQRAVSNDATSVAYVTRPLHGPPVEIGLRFDTSGQVTEVPLPPEVRLSRSGWRIEQFARADSPADCRRIRWLEDTPFYSRSEISGKMNGQTVRAIHESLSLKRFSSRTVQLMLPFRAPRIRWSS